MYFVYFWISPRIFATNIACGAVGKYFSSVRNKTTYEKKGWHQEKHGNVWWYKVYSDRHSCRASVTPCRPACHTGSPDFLGTQCLPFPMCAVCRYTFTEEQVRKLFLLDALDLHTWHLTFFANLHNLGNSHFDCIFRDLLISMLSSIDNVDKVDNVDNVGTVNETMWSNIRQ